MTTLDDGSDVSASQGERVRATGFSRAEKLVVGLLVGAGFMLSVDFSILNVALPAVAAGVGLSRGALPWVTAAYALPAAALTLLFGRLADLWGRRRMFMVGMVVLAGASVLGGIAADPATLLTARALQGTATAIATPAALSLLTTTVGEGPRRARVLGINGALMSAGFTVGALAGGGLVGLLGWRAALLINVPVALVIVALTPRLIADQQTRTRTRLDVPGSLLVSLGLLSAVYGVTTSDIALVALGLGLLLGFALVERRAAAPLIHLELLRRPTVLWGNVAGFVTLASEPAVIFLLTLYLQRILDLSPFETGLVFGIPGLGSVAAGLVAARLIGRFGAARVLTGGLAVQALATVPMLLLTTSRGSLFLLMPCLFVSFFGHVTAIVTYVVAATAGLPDDQQGLATGVATMSQQVALTVGIPLLSAVALTQAAPLTGLRLALIIAIAVTLATAALVLLALHRRSPEPTRTDPPAPTTTWPVRPPEGPRLVSSTTATRGPNVTGNSFRTEIELAATAAEVFAGVRDLRGWWSPTVEGSSSETGDESSAATRGSDTPGSRWRGSNPMR